MLDCLPGTWAGKGHGEINEVEPLPPAKPTEEKADPSGNDMEDYSESPTYMLADAEATPAPNALQEKTRMLVEAVGLLKQQAAEFESMLGNRRDVLAAEVIVFAHYDALLALKATTQEETR